MRVYLYLDCSTCYSQNGLGHWGEGQVTCLKVIICSPLDAKFQERYQYEEGSLISCLLPLQQPLWALLPKMEYVKPHKNITYDMSPGPVFHVDSEYEVRIPIFHLHQML